MYHLLVYHGLVILQRVHLWCDTGSVPLTYKSLTGIMLTGPTLTTAKLTVVMLTGTMLVAETLTNVIFIGVMLTGGDTDHR